MEGSSSSRTPKPETPFANLTIVDLGKLHELVKPLAEFLGNNLETRAKVKGSTVQIDQSRHKDVKLALHKFLHHYGLDYYRIVTELETISVLPPKKPHPESPPEQSSFGVGLSPFSPCRMNPMSSVIYPNYPAVPARKYKQRRKKKS